MNKKTSQTQWDYPEEEDEEEADEAGHTDRQHSMSSSPQRDMDEDVSQTSDIGHLNGEEASSSTTDTETKPKLKESKKLEKSQNSTVDSQDREKCSVDHSDSMDIENQVEDSSDVSQCVEGDSVSSTVQPSSEAGVPDTTSILSVMDEIFQGKSKHGKAAPGTSVSQSYDYTNSTAAASVMQGEPPPPGTDLDLLLAAPPPPPPPADEDSNGPMDAYDTSVPMAMNSHSLSYSSIDGDPMVHSSVSDTIMYPSEAGIMSAESTYVSERTDAPQVVTQEPVVIARPPQVFSSRDEPGSSGEVVSCTEAVPESGSGEDVSPSPAAALAAATVELPSSSGITSEKKKKKKDKSISGSGLHLKKKNVTSLVQKWQKVKKEVEIEERNREEREQAIRQKLEEWKQEYS